ncbi:MAG: alanine racemase, partial [Pyrinomonadaceae bacterium]
MTKPWEIENFLDSRSDQLHIGGVNAVELAREYGTPLFVYSESRIRHNIDRLRKSADVIDCPLKLCYAAKAMSTMGILKAVKDAGSDIEVNSGGELWKALKIGFTGDQIIFNGTSKDVWEIENAINADIYAIQVDSLYELSLIEDAAKRLGKKANVSLRLVPEIETGTHSGLQTALLTSKFGMMPDEAFNAFHTYKESPNLDLCGIHLHIGSQNPDAQVYSEALELLFASLLRIHAETGITLKHINLGGGFPVNYLRSGDEYWRRPIEMSERVWEKGDPPRNAAAKVNEKLSAMKGRYEMLSAGFEPDDALSKAWNAIKQRAADTESAHLIENITL